MVDGEIVAEAGNSAATTGDPTGHAEINLVRLAASKLSPEVLRSSTLYTSTVREASEACLRRAGL